MVRTIAGSTTSGTVDGVGTNSQFRYIYSIAVNSAGVVFVGDNTYNQVRQLNPINAAACASGRSFFSGTYSSDSVQGNISTQ